MGFTKQSDIIELNAYLTQLGKSKILKGTTPSERNIKYFTLGDSDTDYNIAVNPVTGDPDGVKNYLPSGTVPDITGDRNSCTSGVQDGIDIKYKLFYTGNTSTSSVSRELRFITTSNPLGVNNLEYTIDLSKYIKWFEYYGKYSKNLNDSFNKVENLRNPFIKFYDSIRIGNNLNQLSNPTDIQFDLSSSDYQLYNSLNRFNLVIDETTNNVSYRITNPGSNKISSPLVFMFSSNNNNINLAGNGGIVLHNRDYRNNEYYVTDLNTGELVLVPYVNGVFQLPTNNISEIDERFGFQTVAPSLKVNYYKNNQINTKTFIYRGIEDFFLFDEPNNNYLKTYVNYDDKKTVSQFEAELLKEFIVTRNDVFMQTNNGVYISKPLTFYIKTSDKNIKNASLTLKFKYDTNYNSIPSTQETFIS